MTDNNIQRYTFWKFHPSEIKEKADGEWIKHKDHIKAMEAQAKEIERLKKAAHELASNILAHLVNETEFSDDLAMQSLAIHVKEDLCK